MLLMSKPKKRGPKPGPPTEQIGVRIPLDLLAVIDGARKTEKRTRTAEILLAVEAWYAAKGLWPPAGEKPKEARQQP
jgi:hypothetical protein